MTSIELHPDRLLPADAGVRDIARRIYAGTAGLSIVSPHGHVDPWLLANNTPFPDPASLLITPDHYVTRLLHARGVSLQALGVGGNAADPREVWRILCSHWPVFLATPSRYWMENELVQVFGVDTVLSPATADATFDELTDRLASPEFLPRRLFASFRIAALATTDDPVSDLAAHRRLAGDPEFTGRVVPTFRPDGYLDPAQPGWAERIRALGEAADVDTGSYRGFIAALEGRRRYFIANGATATDAGPADAGTEPLSAAQAAGIYASALRGQVAEPDATAFRRHMICELARMSCDDGLVMQLHPSVVRNYHSPTYERFGADTGHDIPVAAEFTRSLRPMLARYGTHPNFRLVLFTVDEDVWAREIAPLAGFFPSVYVGVPWWFGDTPDAMTRFRETVTDTVGFYRTSGFVDDTRAFCSIPVRHDTARRVDAGYLARLVAEHRMSEDDAVSVASDLAYDIPADLFRLR